MIVGILICAALMLALNLVSPQWWWIMVVPAVAGFIWYPTLRKAAVIGGVSAGLVWLAAALYFWLNGGEIIGSRVAALLHVGSVWVLIAADALVGLLAGAVSAAMGSALRSWLASEE
jgi:hypothetical protein